MEIITPQDYRREARKAKRRSARPCDSCRRRKTRCVTREGDDNCVHCQLRDAHCTFDQVAPDRVPPANTTGNEAAHRPLRNSGRSASMMMTSQPSRPLHSPAETSTQSPVGVREQNHTLLSERESSYDSLTLGLVSSRFAELYGLSSDMEPILMRHRPYDRDTHEFSLQTHSIRRVLEEDDGQEYPLTFHMAADEKAVDEDATHSLVDAVEDCIRPHGPRLLELFWRHVQPCYPILAKDVFAQAHAQSYRKVSAALLGAVYLSALRWWSYDPDLSIHKPPDPASLRHLLKTTIPASYHRPKLSSIQAVLLLLQCQPEDPLNPDHSYAWGLTCQALAIGQCLGLHLDASNWSIPLWERNLRKRLSWALYMQDRWTALAYGRPVHIHDDDWMVQDLSNLDFTDYDSSAATVQDSERRSIATTGKVEFMMMVHLTQILSAVLSTFYTAKASRLQDTVVLFDQARPLLKKLDSWYSSIPPSLQMDVTYQRKLCFHGYLHFSYYGVVMTILRRLVRSTALAPRCADDRVLSDIRQLALQTAQNATSFVTNLRSDHLEAFWYFTSPYLFSLLGSFTTLLLVTSLSSQERSFWQESLNSYLWRLRTLSKSCEPMRYAVNRLEGAILRGLEHALAVNLNEPMDEDVSPMMVNHAPDVYTFTDFGDWDLVADDGGTFDLLSAMVLQSDTLFADGTGL